MWQIVFHFVLLLTSLVVCRDIKRPVQDIDKVVYQFWILKTPETVSHSKEPTDETTWSIIDIDTEIFGNLNKRETFTTPPLLRTDQNNELLEAAESHIFRPLFRNRVRKSSNR